MKFLNLATLGFKEIFYFVKYFFIDASNYGLTESIYVDLEEFEDFHYNSDSLQTIHRTMEWYPVYSSSYLSVNTANPPQFECSGDSPIQSSIDLIVSLVSYLIERNFGDLVKFLLL